MVSRLRSSWSCCRFFSPIFSKAAAFGENSVDLDAVTFQTVGEVSSIEYAAGNFICKNRFTSVSSFASFSSVGASSSGSSRRARRRVGDRAIACGVNDAWEMRLMGLGLENNNP